ncbi:MAG: DUF4920 domain-containing protein [Sphingobacteriaceae bacterium]|nr:DUF4920 domain-containing protein [Sphingobacteriaceae bacterium]
MKKIALSIIALATIFTFCTEPKEEAKGKNSTTKDTTLLYFGDTISVEGAVAASELVNQLTGKDSLYIKLTGVIDEVCQKKGCWMTLDIGNGMEMRVSFKDYGFFMPKDASGKTVIIDGYAYNDTIPVEQLRHYAEDAGESKEEIAKIVAPEISISFEANGVIIKK